MGAAGIWRRPQRCPIRKRFATLPVEVGAIPAIWAGDVEMDFLVRTLIVVVLGYGLLVGCAWGFQRALLYHPDRSLPAPEIARAAGLAPVRLLTED